MMKTCLFACLFTFAACNLLAQNADINLLRQINPANPNSNFWKGCSVSAYPVTIGVQGGLMIYDYYYSDSSRGRTLPHIAEKLVVVVLTEALKLAVNRPRPYVTYTGLVHPYQSGETGLSFPSAHTSVAFNTAEALSLRFKKWYITIPAYCWAGCVGYSRLYLGEHYPTDVLAGGALGIGSAYLSRWLDQKLFRGSNKRG